MSKRFTDTAKWSDPWFRRATPATKLLWIWLVDNCDQVGVIDFDAELASFMIGMEVGNNEIEGLGGRVEMLSNGKLLIVDFLEFQCGKLSKKCPAHKPIFKLLEKHSFTDNTLSNRVFNRVSDTLQEKEKEKEKEIETEKETEKEEERPGKSWSPDPDQLRINALFNRRESTQWSDKEIRAYRKLTIDAEDLELLSRYYLATDIPDDKNIRRRDIVTLLNNWPGEVDRARDYCQKIDDRKNRTF